MRLVLRTMLSAPLLPRQVLLVHRPRMAPDTLWVRLPPALRCCACVTAYRQRRHPPVLPGERTQGLLNGRRVPSG